MDLRVGREGVERVGCNQVIVNYTSSNRQSNSPLLTNLSLFLFFITSSLLFWSQISLVIIIIPLLCHYFGRDATRLEPEPLPDGWLERHDVAGIPHLVPLEDFFLGVVGA